MKNNLIKNYGEEKATKRLAFLWAFIERLGLMMEQVAGIMQITPQALYRIKRIDDIRLRRLEDFFKYLGYAVDISLKQNPYAKDEPPVRLGDWYIYFERGQLQFLCQALGTGRITMEMLSTALGLSSNSIRHTFKVNDIDFSKLCKIADTFGMSITITIKPIVGKERHASIPGSRLIVSASFQDTYDNMPII